MKFLLPSRLTTEMVENVYSIVRTCCGDPFPTPLQGMNELKTITLSAALDPPRGSSYASAEGWNAVTLLDLSKRNPKNLTTADCQQQPEVISWCPTSDNLTKDDYEAYGIYHMSGWSLTKVHF